MIKHFLILCFLCFSLSGMSTHIVGGNLKVEQVSKNGFVVELAVFRDCGIGDPNDRTDDPVALQNSINIRVYDAQSYALVNTYNFSRESGEEITLGNACYSPPNLCVEEYHFTQSISLWDNPNGYIIAAQTCCRNFSILNLVDPGQTGITWQAKIPDPAISKFNSSPVLGPYPSLGFLCLLTDFEIDLSATDDDGDSLVYELVTPLDGASSGNQNQNGFSNPPFKMVNWKQNYSTLNAIPGNPSLKIDKQTGLLSCHATQLGVYVFAYKVSEFRNGQKIGEIYRDLQLEVLNCTPASEPEIIEPSLDVYTMESTDELCLNLYATDANNNDTLYFEAIYSGSVMDYTDGPDPFYTIGIGNTSGEICWKPKCLGLIGNQTLHIELRLTSLGCYAPQYKTKHIDVIIENPAKDINTLFPNVFTPNGDNQNDFFKPSEISESDCLEFLQYKIYNRWGEMLFETKQNSAFWDGKYEGNPVSEGVYYYVASGSYLGKNFNFSSHITLVR